MSGTWSRLVALLDRRETGEPLALFRIASGLSLLYALGTVWGHGLVPVIWIDREYGGMRSLGKTGSWLVALLGGPRPDVVWSLMGITALAALFLLAGLGTRLAAFIGLQGFMALAWINGHTGGSYDNLFTNALWLLVLARSDATLSLACRLRTGRWLSDTLVTAWPRWLVVLQIVVLYTSTGTQKVSAYWVPGGDFSALYYILQQPSWARWDLRWLAWIFPVTQLMTAVVWLFEVTAPLLLLGFWYRLTRQRPGRLRAIFNRLDHRSLFATFGLGMHLGILILMEVGPFSFISLALYPCLFSGDEWRRAGARIVGRRVRVLSPGGPAEGAGPRGQDTASPRGSSGLQSA